MEISHKISLNILNIKIHFYTMINYHNILFYHNNIEEPHI